MMNTIAGINPEVQRTQYDLVNKQIDLETLNPEDTIDEAYDPGVDYRGSFQALYKHMNDAQTWSLINGAGLGAIEAMRRI